MSHTSSTLLAKLESINWSYSIQTVLLGVKSNLLVKYTIEDDAYAIMVTDFSTTYFECLIGEQIEKHYHRFNIKSKQLSYKEILIYLADLLQDIRLSNTLTIEKLAVECHTTRINIKTSKIFSTNPFKINWNFYIISTEPDTFMRHFSLPLWRGMMHYYRLANDNTNLENHNIANGNAINDQILNEVFR